MDTPMPEPTTVRHSEHSTAATNSESSRCQYRYSNGKRCRLPGSEPHFGLCSHHFSLANPGASQQPFSDSEDLSAELLPELSEFNSAININKFLARLLVLVTRGRLSPRRASVLAYIANQLLHPPRAIPRDVSLQPREQGRRPMFDFTNWPTPEGGSHIKGPACHQMDVGVGALRDQEKPSS